MRLPAAVTLVLPVLLAVLVARTSRGSETFRTVPWELRSQAARATPTVEVVPTPFLSGVRSPAFAALADKHWKLLEGLGASHARYVAWYPLPRYALVSLNETLVDRVLNSFLCACAKRPSSISFPTHPSSLFSGGEVPVPDDPDVVVWSYSEGRFVVSSFAAIVNASVQSYAWLLSKSYPVARWEVLNENERLLNSEQYVALFRAVVAGVTREAAKRGVTPPEFVGLSGASPSWAEDLLCSQPELPVRHLSLHFRTSFHGSGDPYSLEELFSAVDQFVGMLKNQVAPLVSSCRPENPPQIAVGEAAFLMPHDADSTKRKPATPEFVVASASAFVKLFMSLTTVPQVSTVTMAMLSAFGPTTLEGQTISSSMLPSLTMIDPVKGEPNVKYWALKLLIDHAGPGTFVTTADMLPIAAAARFCGSSESRDGFPKFSMECSHPESKIVGVEFAGLGTVAGHCGNYQLVEPCGVLRVDAINSLCLGKHDCLIEPLSANPPNHCIATVEKFVVQMRCQNDTGFSSLYDEGDVLVYGLREPGTGRHKILLVNCENEEAFVSISNSIKAASYTMIAIDESTPSSGPVPTSLTSLDHILLHRFSTALIFLD